MTCSSSSSKTSISSSVCCRSKEQGLTIQLSSLAMIYNTEVGDKFAQSQHVERKGIWALNTSLRNTVFRLRLHDNFSILFSVNFLKQFHDNDRAHESAENTRGAVVHMPRQ